MLEGRLVRLRAVEAADRGRAAAWLNDPQVTYYLSERYGRAGDGETWLSDDSANGFAAGVRLAVETKDGVHIGAVNLHRISAEDRKAGLGIIIGAKEHWARGYGGDAVVTLLRFGFHEMNLNRVWLTTVEYNKRAIACYKRCGFREEARRRQEVYRHGRYWDFIVMGILRNEFERLHGSSGGGDDA